MYRIFYNHKSVGDVLMIIFKPSIYPNKTIKHENVASLYYNDELIGVNIFEFSKICKIHSEGMIVAPSSKLIEIINHILINSGLTKLDEIDSGFVVGKVISCVDHPNSDHLHVTKVDIGSEVLDIVCGAANVCEGIKVVVAKPGTIMFDGTQIIPSKMRGEPSNGMLCSAKELHLDNYQSQKGLLLVDDKMNIGDDFF